VNTPKPISPALLRWSSEKKKRREAGLYWTDEVKDAIREAKREAWDEGQRAATSEEYTDNPYRYRGVSDE